MIPHTFIHIPGIGPKMEERLWREGVTSIEDLASLVEEQAETECAAENGTASRLAERVRRVIAESIEALAREDWCYFYRKLPAREHWRLIPHFRRPAFLDIETTGLDRSFHHITVIGIYDGTTLYSYVHGKNLADFPRDFERFDAVVTYSGKAFDMPFLLSAFDIPTGKPHVDLRHVFASEGLKGGLKKVERLLGMEREETVREIDGGTAVVLWNEYVRRGDGKALETLLAYNTADTVNLHALAVRAYNMKLPEFFRHLALPEDITPPPPPYAADPRVVARVTGRRELR